MSFLKLTPSRTIVIECFNDEDSFDFLVEIKAPRGSPREDRKTIAVKLVVENGTLSVKTKALQ